MELKQLKCFLTVAELKNFTRAAEFLYTSQSTLSYQIGKLEEEIGGALFVRSLPLTLTPLGEAMLDPVRQILSDVNRLSDIYQHQAELLPQTLRLGISDLGHECMFNGCLEDVGKFLHGNPRIKLETSILTNDECKAGLVDGTLDAALITRVHQESLPSALDSMTVLLDRHVLVYHTEFSQYPLQEYLHKFPLAMHNGNLKGNRRIFAALGLEENYSNVILTGNLTGLTILALSKRAAAIFPYSYFDLIRMPMLRAVEIGRQSIFLRRDIAWNKQKENPAVKRLIQSMTPVMSMEA